MSGTLAKLRDSLEHSQPVCFSRLPPLRRRSSMIIEGIVTSIDAEDRLNVAPMGPIVVGDFTSLVLRPFQPSATFRNLSTTRCGVFHITDQIDIIARAVTGNLHTLPPTEAALHIRGQVLSDCCRWLEFEIESIDDSSPRSIMPARIVHQGEKRPFRGFNRARHAVIEAAILATRLHLLPAAEIETALKFLAPAVEKTGGAIEQECWEMIVGFIHARQARQESPR